MSLVSRAPSPGLTPSWPEVVAKHPTKSMLKFWAMSCSQAVALAANWLLELHKVENILM